MTERDNIIAESQTAGAVKAATEAQQAIEKARQAQMVAAADTAIERFVAKIKDRKHKESVFSDVEREEVKNIVHEALNEFFKTYGLRGKNLIVTAALLIGALVVIFGGIKSVLGWLGFMYVK